MSETLLSKELEYLSREAREMVLDSIYCTLHNKGYSLQGNTEESDVRWFAQLIWCEYRGTGTNWQWEQLPTTEQERWKKIAEACLKQLPSLMDRISHRVQLMKEAINTLLQAEKSREDRHRP